MSETNYTGQLECDEPEHCTCPSGAERCTRPTAEESARQFEREQAKRSGLKCEIFYTEGGAV